LQWFNPRGVVLRANLDNLSVLLSRKPELPV
jgi:hypothetical protein